MTRGPCSSRISGPARESLADEVEVMKDVCAERSQSSVIIGPDTRAGERPLPASLSLGRCVMMKIEGPEARAARRRYDRSVYDRTVPRPPQRGNSHCFRARA